MANVAEETKIETPVAPIDVYRFSEAQFRRNEYVVNLTVDFPYENLFKPDTWKSIARIGKLNAGDLVEVRKDDLSLWALLLVRESIANHAHVVVVELFKKEFAPAVQDETEDSQYDIKHAGLQDGWTVVLKSTGRLLVKNLKSRDAAKDYVHSLRPKPIGR